MAVLDYRPEVDGLRAVAVAAVVLFHAQLGILSGGFVGVDVFFVISGYLISSIIARELDSGTFSLLSFYERRIRRIFPALLVVVAACLALGAWRMAPLQFDHLGESALAAIGFHSNLYFANQAGYFMPSAETLPLLHTWSLGVEEQFYVLAPLLLMAIWSYRLRLATVLSVLLVAALAASLWGTASNSDTAFYLPQTRAIELMIGMVLGLRLVPDVQSQRARQVLSAAGLILIVISASLYSSATPFPGMAALVPCLGSALVIHCTGGTHGTNLVGRLLSTPPVVWLGKISYSLYLWHWPLFAFAAYEWGEVHVAGRLALVAASVALAAATYHWIEQPARTSRTILTRSRVYGAGLGSAGLLAGIAAVIALTGGWPSRLPSAVAAIDATATMRSYRGASCVAVLKGRREGPCRLGDHKGPAQILVWGDSHAQALEKLFDDLGKNLGVSVLMFVGSACPPLFDSGMHANLGKKECKKHPSKISEVLESGTVRHVVLTARWGGYTGRPANERYDRKIGDHITTSGSVEIERLFKASFARTLTRLHDTGLRVTLIGPVPELPVHLPSAMTKAYMRGREFSLDYDFSRFSKRQFLVLNLLADAEKLARVDIIYPDRILCPLGQCRFVDSDGLPLYRDDDHLSPYGGELLKPALTRALEWLDRTNIDTSANKTSK